MNGLKCEKYHNEVTIRRSCHNRQQLSSPCCVQYRVQCPVSGVQYVCCSTGSIEAKGHRTSYPAAQRKCDVIRISWFAPMGIFGDDSAGSYPGILIKFDQS